MSYNEYCKFCTWFDWRRTFCNLHKRDVAEFDTCNDFKSTGG